MKPTGMFKSSSHLIINIIYVKGTVELLKGFFFTLLKHSDCRFRLVSNGCLPEEELTLAALAESSPRITFYSFANQKVLEHHSCLNKLLEMEETEYFAFFDSDILATGVFLKEMLEKMGDSDGFFSGFPIWHEDYEIVMPRKFKILGGRFLENHNGLILGFSYCAIYRTQSLKNFIEATGIGFERYTWDQIPEKYRSVLINLECRNRFYDTGKVLNILMQQQGYFFTYGRTSSIIHLGGISGIALQKEQILKRLINHSRFYLPNTLRIFMRQIKNYWRKRISFSESKDLEYLSNRRLATEYLFHYYLNKDGESLPVSSSKHLSKKLELEVKQIVTVLEQSAKHKSDFNAVGR